MRALMLAAVLFLASNAAMAQTNSGRVTLPFGSLCYASTSLQQNGGTFEASLYSKDHTYTSVIDKEKDPVLFDFLLSQRGSLNIPCTSERLTWTRMYLESPEMRTDFDERRPGTFDQFVAARFKKLLIEVAQNNKTSQEIFKNWECQTFEVYANEERVCFDYNVTGEDAQNLNLKISAKVGRLFNLETEDLYEVEIPVAKDKKENTEFIGLLKSWASSGQNSAHVPWTFNKHDGMKLRWDITLAASYLKSGYYKGKTMDENRAAKLRTLITRKFLSSFNRVNLK